MKYQKSLAILEKYKPDAKYRFDTGIVHSDVTYKELSPDTEAGMELMMLGWMIENHWYRIL